jgi:hypothetical protein
MFNQVFGFEILINWDFKCFFEGVCSLLLDLESRHFHGQQENNRIGLPTSSSSSDVQNRMLQADAKHESQPSETEVQNPSPESVTPLNEKVDLSEA